MFSTEKRHAPPEKNDARSGGALARQTATAQSAVAVAMALKRGSEFTDARSGLSATALSTEEVAGL